MKLTRRRFIFASSAAVAAGTAAATAPRSNLDAEGRYNRIDVKFVRAAEAPATPTGHDPAGWSDVVPMSLDPLWFSKAVFDPMHQRMLEPWSTPIRVT